MPIHKEGGGYQWGNRGKLYHGHNANEKAEKQAAAAHANGYRGDAVTDEPKKCADSKPMTEWDAIQGVRNGSLPSPSRYGGMWLFAVRVTGTGISFRPQHNEWVYRPPEYYLNDEFLERVKGLPILMMHTEDGPVQGEEYRQKNIGNLVAPWIRNSDVWGIAKVYNDDDAQLIIEYFSSTSPSVSFDERGESTYVEAPDGKKMLVEGAPDFIDHLAMVPAGVWDRFGPPSGVSFDY